MPHPGTGSHQGIGLETERCIFSWDGPGGLTWEGDGPVITSQMPEKKSLQQPESCSSTGGWQTVPWWPRGVCLPASSRLSVLPAPVLSSDSEQWEGREVTEEQRAGTGMETKPRALGGLHLHRAWAAWAAGGLVEVRVCGPQEPQLTSEWQQQDALR
ncbi:hypothetical protein D623_10028521 [Myotis brandtii]|uniref:Uncharacterized protein n=1 Tax=Myotis brandtii TaxID=109478 RepID=S7PET1_MYOBR|nr:hypothetical protein D623_10028521 [Myotis brandtii]